MQYTSGDASKLMTFTPVLNKLEHRPPLSGVLQNGLRSRGKTAAGVCIVLFYCPFSFLVDCYLTYVVIVFQLYSNMAITD